MLDTSIVNVALPTIQADLTLDPTGLSWVVNAYVLTLGTATFTAIALSAGRPDDGMHAHSGFPAAFTVAALVALATAALGCTIARGPRRAGPE